MLKPTKHTLFPTLHSLDACMEHLVSQLPINNRNQLTSALMTYQNTLLEQVGATYIVTEDVLNHFRTYTIPITKDDDLHRTHFKQAYNQAIADVIQHIENRMRM